MNSTLAATSVGQCIPRETVLLAGTGVLLAVAVDRPPVHALTNLTRGCPAARSGTSAATHRTIKG